MSLLATGLLIELRTSWPEDLKINSDTIRERHPDIGGRDKARRVMAELVTNGTLIKSICRFNNGYMTVYTLAENQAPLSPGLKNQAPHVQTVSAPDYIMISSQVDNTSITTERNPRSDRVSKTRPLQQCLSVAIDSSYLSTILGTSYPPDLTVGREVPMNKWKEEEPTMVFGSVPEDNIPLRSKTILEKASERNLLVKDKTKLSIVDVVYHFQVQFRLKRPMDNFFPIDRVRKSMLTFRSNHQTTSVEELQLIKDYFSLPQHYASTMSALHVWWKFLTFAAAHVGRVKALGIAEPSMTDSEADAILAASMEKLMSL